MNIFDKPIEVWVRLRSADPHDKPYYGLWIGTVDIYQHPDGHYDEKDGDGAKKLEYPVAKLSLGTDIILYGCEVWWGRLLAR